MSRLMRTAFASMTLFLLSTSCGARQESPVESITAAKLREHISYLASDGLGGRYIGSPGFEAAARYAESRFKAAGLVPIAREGNRTTYLQNVPLLKRTTTAEPVLTIKTSEEETTFVHAKDFKWFIGDMTPCERKSLQVVYAGYGISEPRYGWDDFEGLDVAGKVVVILMGAPMRGGAPVLPAEVHERYAPAPALLNKVFPIIARRPAAIFVLPNEELMAAWESLPMATREPNLAYANRDAGAFHVGCLCLIQPQVERRLFAGQGRVPPRAGLSGTETTKGFLLENVSLTLGASFAEEEVSTWNVIGAVKGTDPSLGNEYVVVSAHLDTKAPEKPGEIYNGADDDASGSAGVMAVAEAVAMRPPKRSVMFVLFTGEEGGVVGSRHFLSRCPIPLGKIVADVNMDMIGRSAPESEADRAEYALDSDKISPALTELIRAVNDRTVRWPLKYEYRMGESDHLMFIAAGIPAVNFYSGHHADVNKTTDDAEKIDYEKAQQISRLVYEVAMELGNREKPLR